LEKPPTSIEEVKKFLDDFLSMGYPGSSTICISFHIAEKNMNYPFKKEKK
jgi:hypothetical protein